LRTVLRDGFISRVISGLQPCFQKGYYAKTPFLDFNICPPLSLEAIWFDVRR